MEYRLHLLDETRGVIATVPFVAGVDGDAIKIASVIFEWCRDVAAGCEVWSGPEVIATEHHAAFQRVPPLSGFMQEQLERVNGCADVLLKDNDVVRYKRRSQSVPLNRR
jgi:hypothetical protein